MIELYGEGSVSGAKYIKIEFIDMTLEAYTADPAIPGKRSISEIASQMLQCLKQMHQAGCIHQDVKPENFMVQSSKHKVQIHDMNYVMEYMKNGEHRNFGE